MKRALFVYNPNAGKGKILGQLDKVIETLEEGGFMAAVYRTKAPLDGKKVVMENVDFFDRVICSGGDGTLSETVSAMMELPEEKRIPIGFIPTGSTNDTGRSFGIPLEILEAAKIASFGKPVYTDVGKMNDSYFAYVASFGKLSAVSCFTPQEAKKAFGYGAYLGEGIKAFLDMESYKLRVEYVDGNDELHQEEGTYYLGMVTNTLSVGGFVGITGGDIDLNDGLFEVVLLKKPENIIDLTMQIDNMLFDPDKDYSTDEVSKFKAKKVTFISDDDVQWVIDGENGGLHKKVEIENYHSAVQIMEIDEENSIFSGNE